MICRRHTARDFDRIADLRWDLKTEDLADSALPEKSAFRRGYLAHLRSAETAGQTTHWLLEKHGEVHGVMTLRAVLKETSLSGRTGAWGYLTNVFVSPYCRNQGLGTALLSHVITEARAAEMEFLLVWPSDRSVGFYTRAGFTGAREPLCLEL